MFDPKLTRMTLLFCLLTALTIPLSVQAEDKPSFQDIDDDLALGQDVNRQQAFRPEPGSSSSDLLGARGGYIHPYISLTGRYSDNVYNALTNEVSDYSTIISPGIQLAYPRVRGVSGASFGTSTLTAGGLLASREKVDYFRRFQTSLLYQADVENYTDNSIEDTDHHRAEGLLQFNLKGGVSFDLAGEYKLSSAAISSSAQLDEYQSDLVDLLIGIEIGSKLNLDLGYASFQLDYDAIGNHNLDRQDTTYTGRLSYNITGKTSIFAEYQLIAVDYDLQVFPDNDVQNGNAGIKWDITAKSSGNFKVGQSSREHEDASLADADEMFYQLQAQHLFTPKTSINLSGTRRITEPTVAGTSYIVNNQAYLTYRQELSRKIVAKLDASYARNNFDQPVTYGLETKKRKDNIILVSPTLDYLLRDWFIVSLSYSLSEQDSNFDIFDFTTNSVLLRVTGYI